MRRSLWLKIAMLVISPLLSLQLAAAPGILVDLPLDISRAVQPNILVLLDDSGSMGWSQLISVEGQNLGVVTQNGRGTDLLLMPPRDQTDSDFTCARYNLLAYDPSVRYQPWSGSDSADVPVLYSNLNLSLSASRSNPYFPVVTDISDHLYTSFVDANADAVLNAGECGLYSEFHTFLDAGITVDEDDDLEGRSQTGILTDGGGLFGNYANSVNESFIIDPDGAVNLQILFTAFDLESGWDYLYVTQLNDNLSAAGSRLVFDGDTLPDDGNGVAGQFLFSTGQARIEFITDGSVNKKGFELSWKNPASNSALPKAFVTNETGCRDSDNCTLAKDLPLADADGAVINTQENYSHWYSYYRNRELVSKKALSDIVSESDNRLGLATLNNVDYVGTLIKDMKIDANKTELMTNLFEVRSEGGTPLRQALNNAGLYFDEQESIPSALFEIDDDETTPNHSGDGTISNDSPILNQAGGGICQQNFAVLFSDGEWNGYLSNVGDTDSDGVSSNADGDTFFDGATFADTFGPSNTANKANTLADVAMRYLEKDLASNLANNNTVRDIHHIEESPSDRRIMSHQHMSTYTVAFGLTGTLDGNPSRPDQVPSVLPEEPYTFSGWTDPIDANPSATRSARRTDDMRHAAWNGRGEFLSAANPEQLISTLNAAINSIGDRTEATSAGSTFNSTIISGDTLIFRGSFVTNDWIGDLQAFQFDDDGIVDRLVTGDESDDVVWSAASKLADKVGDNTDGTRGFLRRNVVTYNGERAVAFDFPDDLSALSNATLTQAQVNRLLEAFDADAPNATSEERRDYGNLLVNFLKGDSDHEGTLFRRRFNQYLGPIINSSPQFVGAPNELYPDLISHTSTSDTQPVASDSVRYSKFQKDNVNRMPLVYVGGNDGMLHAFEAGGVSVDANGVETAVSGGDEIFAYIPKFLKNNIQTLAENSYAHLAYVDGTPTVRDVYLTPFAGEPPSWRTYLVSAARSGGRGVFVLDVTDPNVLANAATAARASSSSTLNSPVKFEYTSVDDADLGFVYGRPQIAKMNNGKWVAIVPNGYNSSGDGQAHLFIIDLETGVLLKKISTGVGSRAVGLTCTDSASNCNGLSSPTIADLNGDFIVDRIYAGDLHGNLWAFDVSSSAAADWDVAFGDSNVKRPLFSACANDDACSPSLTDNRQAITAAPEIIFHPSKNSLSTEPNMLVYFGTGQFIAANDQVNDTTQSFYAIWDSGTEPTVTGDADRTGNLTRSNLQQQGFEVVGSGAEEKINVRGVDASGSLSDNATVEYDVAGEQGWFIDFEITADTNFLSRGRSIITPLVINEIVVFIITVPTGDICVPVGSSNIVALDALDGSAPSPSVFAGPKVDANGFFVKIENASIVDLSAIINQEGELNIKVDESENRPSLEDPNTSNPIPLGRKSWSILR
jgi:type IV pilus assembly protein PilY1